MDQDSSQLHTLAHKGRTKVPVIENDIPLAKAISN
jgi:hypothetical protein